MQLWAAFWLAFACDSLDHTRRYKVRPCQLLPVLNENLENALWITLGECNEPVRGFKRIPLTPKLPQWESGASAEAHDSHLGSFGVIGIRWAKWLQAKIERVINEWSLCQIFVPLPVHPYRFLYIGHLFSRL